MHSLGCRSTTTGFTLVRSGLQAARPIVLCPLRLGLGNFPKYSDQSFRGAFRTALRPGHLHQSPKMSALAQEVDCGECKVMRSAMDRMMCFRDGDYDTTELELA